MKFNLVVLRQANRDLDIILNHLDSKSHRGANTWYRQWLNTCDTLRASADSFGLADENDEAEFTVQQYTFKTRRGLPYRVLYRIVDNTVYVYHVRGPGQDLAYNLDNIELPKK